MSKPIVLFLALTVVVLFGLGLWLPDAKAGVVPQPLVITASCQPGTAGKPTNCNTSASGGTAPYRFLWDVGKDGTVDASGPSATFIFPTKGTFSIDARVLDFNNSTAFVNLPIVVIAQPLVITTSCFPGTAGKPTTCASSASGGTTPYTFFWDVGKDGTIDASGRNASFTFPAAGTFSIDSIVIDANNATAFVNLPITVRSQALVITVGCQPGTAGKPTNCSASASGGTTPYTFLWDVGKDGTIDASGGNASFVFPVKGTFSIDGIVIDGNNATAFVNLPIIVRPQPLVITASCQPGTAGKPTNCSSSASSGTTPYTFLWDVGKDGTIDAYGSAATVVFPVKGTFSLDAIVLDANNATAFVNLPIVVRPQPVVADFESRCVGSTGSVEFTATVSGGTTPYTFSWNFGDGTSGTGNPVSHTYSPAGIFTVTLTLNDANGIQVIVTHKIIACGVAITDSSLCSFDRDPNRAGQQFRLIFVQDPLNMSTFKLVASNPGQFYNNVFYTGTAGTKVTLTINIPYPFVTQGSVPVQVHDSVTLNSNGCFLPGPQTNSSFTITAAGSLSPSGDPIVLLGDYAGSFGSTIPITVQGLVSSSGLVYVTIHLDYGLKGAVGYLKGEAGGVSDTLDAIDTTIPISTILNFQSYTFTTKGSLASTSTVESENVFKRDPGFAGVVTDSSGTPVPGVRVEIWSPKNVRLAVVYTDKDGFYQYQYKYSGKPAMFTIKLPEYGLSQTVELKSNKVVLANFVISL